MIEDVFTEAWLSAHWYARGRGESVEDAREFAAYHAKNMREVAESNLDRAGVWDIPTSYLRWDKNR